MQGTCILYMYMYRSTYMVGVIYIRKTFCSLKVFALTAWNCLHNSCTYSIPFNTPLHLNRRSSYTITCNYSIPPFKLHVLFKLILPFKPSCTSLKNVWCFLIGPFFVAHRVCFVGCRVCHFSILIAFLCSACLN